MSTGSYCAVLYFQVGRLGQQTPRPTRAMERCWAPWGWAAARQSKLPITRAPAHSPRGRAKVAVWMERGAMVSASRTLKSRSTAIGFAAPSSTDTSAEVVSPV